MASFCRFCQISVINTRSIAVEIVTTIWAPWLPQYHSFTRRTWLKSFSCYGNRRFTTPSLVAVFASAQAQVRGWSNESYPTMHAFCSMHTQSYYITKEQAPLHCRVWVFRQLRLFFFLQLDCRVWLCFYRWWRCDNVWGWHRVTTSDQRVIRASVWRQCYHRWVHTLCVRARVAAVDASASAHACMVRFVCACFIPGSRWLT